MMCAWTSPSLRIASIIGPTSFELSAGIDVEKDDVQDADEVGRPKNFIEFGNLNFGCHFSAFSIFFATLLVLLV